MLRTEVRVCVNCKKNYIWKGGGIIMNLNDVDFGLCPSCRKKEALKMLFRKK